jgi:hypothetical protein
VAQGGDENDGELPGDFDEELDEDVEELLAAWDVADEDAASILCEALRDHRGAEPPPLDGVAGRLRDDIRARRDPAAWMHRGSGMGAKLPAEDAELLLRCLQAVVAGPEDRGLDVEEETMLDTLEHADWLGAVVSLVRAGPGASADPGAIVRGISHCPEVNIPEGVDDLEQSHLEASFSIVSLAWLVAGCVDRDERLTDVGEWALPRALARAWGADFDAP